MPIYEYKCQSCGERSEKLQKLNDPPCKKCPRCGGLLKKLISSPAIQFKGNGFYITDYPKKGSPGSERKSKEPPAAKPEPSSEKKAEAPSAETKPAAKPAEKKSGA
jgi:putative FmdB family regulatory protein